METLWRDLRQTTRSLRRTPGFTATVVLTLAIGIGVNTALFSVVHKILLEPLPYPEPDRLVMVWTHIRGQGVREAASAYANVRDWREQNRVFEGLATLDPTSMTLTGGELPERIMTVRASANLFQTIGAAPLLGRTFSPEEEEQRARVAVLSHAFWQRWFGGAADVLGRPVELDGVTLQVIGVMPEGSAFPDPGVQVWLPQTLFADWDAVAARRGTDAWRVVGRLRPGVSLERARSEMELVADRLERAYPAANAGLGINLVPLNEQITGRSLRLALWTLFGAVGLVLLIACANAAQMILARGARRREDFALRAALGASTPRLVREALTESIVLAVCAGIAGLLLAIGGLRLLLALGSANLPRVEGIGVDGTVLLYATFVSLATGLAFGIAPAIAQARGAPAGALRAGRGPVPATRALTGGRVLISLQFAIAIVLVFGANLLIRSFLAASGAEPGFDPRDLVMANLSVASPSARTAFYGRVVEEVPAIPGVRSAALVEDLFISGTPNRPITVEGNASADPDLELIRIDAIAGDLFGTIGVPLRAGRAFGPSDNAAAVPVAIINETMARRFWPGESAVGKRFRAGAPDSGEPWIEVVGIVGDMRRQGLERAPIAQVFRPFDQAPSRGMNLLVRSAAPQLDIVTAIRARIADIDSTVPLYGVTTVEQAMDRFLVQRRFQAMLLGLFSALALILAAGGIYGLVHHSVSRRTREIGVRMAVGATSRQIRSMVLRHGLAMALPGLAAGLLVAFGLAGAISGLLFEVSAADPLNVAITVAVLVVATLAACLFPARRAANMQPSAALRQP